MIKHIIKYFLFLVLIISAVLILFTYSSHEVVVAPIEIEKERVPNKASLIFFGDIMLSRSVGAFMDRNNDYTLPFVNVAEKIREADIAFANLENPISDRGIKVGSIYSFRANPRVIEGLVYAGFDVLSIANNHIWDYGREAFLDTLEYLNNAGIKYVGGGVDFEDSHQPLIREVNGMRFAFLAYTNLLPQSAFATDTNPGSNRANLDQVILDVQKANSLADVVIVSFHWGDEYKLNHNDEQGRLARATIDAGADLIIGHHPHVIQEVEKYKDGWIAYSLGNFVFDQTFSKETMTGLGLLVNIVDGLIDSAETMNVNINYSFQPSFSSNKN